MARISMFLGMLAVACQTALGEMPPPSDGSSYTFTLNGKPFTPQVISMRGDPAHPQPGDLIRADYYLLMTLGPERVCRFVTTPEDDGQLLLRLDSGKDRVVGVRLRCLYEKDKKVVINPLAKLSDADVKGLWGIHVDHWPDGVSARLRHIDPARTCITITGAPERPKDGGGKLPSLPEGIQYLMIGDHGSLGVRHDVALQNLKRLRFLCIDHLFAGAFDCRLIAQNASLRHFRLGIGRIIHPEALAELGSMESLDLSWISGLETVAFAAKMPELKRLNVRITKVRDMRPLSGLDKLERVLAQECPIERLPAGLMPALRTLELYSAKLTDVDVEQFAKLHPQCAVLFRRDKALRDFVAKAARLRIRQGSADGLVPDKAATLFEVTDPAKVQEFVRQIEIVDAASCGPACNCGGDPSFEFYDNDRLIAMIGFKDEHRLYWPAQWRGDALLSEQSRKNMFQWLADHGFDYAKKMKEVNEARREQAHKQHLKWEAERKQEKHRAFLACYPQAARRWFDEKIGPKDDGKRARLAAEIAKTVGNPVELVVVTCQALGGENSWGDLDDNALAVEAVGKVSGTCFLAAAEWLRGNKAGEMGAARLFFREGFRTRLPQSQQADWAIHFVRVCFGDDNDEDFYAPLILCLGQIKEPKGTDFLRQIAHGRVKAKVHDDCHGELLVPTAAYLALAEQGCADVKPEIEDLLAKEGDSCDKLAFEVSLALLGNPKYLHAERFRGFSDKLDFVALRAIERFDGREGMGMLIKAAGFFEHFRSLGDADRRHGREAPAFADDYREISREAVLTAERITGQRWCKGKSNEQPEVYGKEVQEWWREHGAEFVKARRADHAKGARTPAAAPDDRTTSSGPAAPADSVPSLIGLLHHNDPIVCGEAAGCLGGMRERAAAAVPELIAMLGDHRPVTPPLAIAFRDLSTCAAGALAKIGQPAVQPLIAVLEKSPDPAVRRAVAESLGGMTRPPVQSLPALVQSLHDADASVRIAAVRAIHGMGHDARQAIPSLIELSQTDPLEGNRIESLFAVAELDGDGRLAVAGCIAALKDKSPNVRGHAARLLGKDGDRAAPAVAALTAALTDKQGRERWGERTGRLFPVRGDVAGALGKIGRSAAPALPSLRTMIKKGQGCEVLAIVAQAIFQIDPHDKQALPALIQMVEDDEPGPLGKAKTTVIMQLGPQDDKAPPMVTEIVETERTRPIGKTAALAALRTLGPAASPAVGAITKALHDMHREIREDAAETLAAVAGRKAVPPLMEQIRWEGSIGKRARAARRDSEYYDDELMILTIAAIFSRMGADAVEAVPLLASLLGAPLGDTDWDRDTTGSRDQRLLADLGAMGPAAKDAVPDMIQVLSRHHFADDDELRRAAAEALGRIGPAAAAALPKLRQVAADDPEEEVRQAARDAVRKIAPKTTL
jgi:HEAT repeat protein